MTQENLPDEATLAEFFAMMAAEGVPEQEARELAAGLSPKELRMLMTAQQKSESDDALLERLMWARSDPRRLAAVLPEAKIQSPVQLAALCLFCVGMLGWVVVMPFSLAGSLLGSLINVGAVIAYVELRPLAKRAGWLSVGAFTLSRDGVFRALSGIGQARRRIRRDGDDTSLRGNMGVGVVFVLIVLGVPVTATILTDRPEIMLGWMVMAMLALNEMVLLVIRQRADSRRRSAVGVDGQFGLSMAVDYLKRGGDARSLLDGIRLDELVPSDEDEFEAMMRDAILRRARVRAQQGD